MKVYGAFNSTPDFHSPPPTLKSLHLTFEGAQKSLYPEMQYEFRTMADLKSWEGPDGFGLIREMEVLP